MFLLDDNKQRSISGPLVFENSTIDKRAMNPRDSFDIPKAEWNHLSLFICLI